MRQQRLEYLIIFIEGERKSVYPLHYKRTHNTISIKPSKETSSTSLLVWWKVPHNKIEETEPGIQTKWTTRTFYKDYREWQESTTYKNGYDGGVDSGREGEKLHLE